MFLTCLSRGLLAALIATLPTLSFAEVVITDPYVRTSRPGAPTGAAFMMIQNAGDTPDRLVSVQSDIAKRVELHAHIDDGNGVMKMVEIDEGIEIAPGATHMMQRGGDHVMFMGLVKTLEQGSAVEATLTFEKAGDVVVTIPVDNERMPKHGGLNHDVKE